MTTWPLRSTSKSNTEPALSRQTNRASEGLLMTRPSMRLTTSPAWNGQNPAGVDWVATTPCVLDSSTSEAEPAWIWARSV
ncbi:hypothetical protein [Cystobacter fuscus]|uniref:hypothetical protein n=1 Tax=Cystobacter fuscus TaxID=43 RepID=UPI0012FDE904|nr:hypothetical protein [Cystobacter fuscus]